jgi:hypothetical protein
MNSTDSFSLLHLPVDKHAAAEPALIDLSRVQRPARAVGQGEFIRMCSWCRRVADGANWVRVDNRPPNQPADARPITHGICPSCLSRVLQHELLTA